MILDQAKRARLWELGYNPNEMEDFTPEPPTVQQNPSVGTPKQQEVSAIGAGFRSALRALPSTVGGIVSGAASGAAGGAIGGPIGAGIGGISGAILGGMGTRMLQDKVVIPNLLSPENAAAYQQSEQQDREQQGLASTIGEIGAGIPFLAPSLRALPGAARALVNPLRGVTSDARDIGNLANVAIGGGLPVGIRAASDPEVTGSELLAEGLGGALLNSPTKLGTKLGLSPNTYRTLPVDPKTATANQQTGNPIPSAKEPLLLPERAEKLELPNSSLLETPVKPSLTDINEQLKSAPLSETAIRESEYLKAQSELQAEQQRVANETAKTREEIERLRKISQAPVAGEIDALESVIQGNQVKGDNYNPKTNPQRSYVPPADPSLVAPLSEGEIIQDQYDRGVRNQEGDALSEKKINVSDAIAKIESRGDEKIVAAALRDPDGTIHTGIIHGQIQGAHPQAEDGFVSNLGNYYNRNQALKFGGSHNEDFVDRNSDGTRNYEGGYTRSKVKVSDPLLRQKLREYYKLENDEPNALVPDPDARNEDTSSNDLAKERVAPIQQGLTDKNIPIKPTVETLEAFKQLGEERNVNIKADKRVFSQQPGGREVSGQSDIRQGTQPVENRINPNKGTVSTLVHELEHNFDDDLEVLGNAKAKAFIARADRIFKDSPVYKEWAEARQREGLSSDIKEFRATLTGEDGIRRLYSTDNKGDIKNWFSDVRAALKIKMNKGTPDDVARVMSAKLLYDAPFKQTFDSKSVKAPVVTGAEERNQEDSAFYNEAPIVLRDSRKFGFGPNSKLAPEYFINRLKNTIKPGEFEALKEAGLEEFVSGTKRTPEEVAKWVEENGPKVEVKELGATNEASALEKERAEIEHWFDTKHGGFPEFTFDGEGKEPSVVSIYRGKRIENPDIETLTKAKRFDELGQKLATVDSRSNDSATARYQMVNPKELDKMPGAVDLLVRIPLRSKKDVYGDEINWTNPKENGLKYSSNHYPQEGKNLLAHVRGYMETTKDGKKVFRVFEMQSDWGQKLQRENKALERVGLSGVSISQSNRGSSMTPGDPLLKHYERLAVKAAIEHARKNGADAIAFDDAETAMITEGHDKLGVPHDGDLNNSGFEESDLITQSKGMRLHYDKTIPKIAEELTGTKGEPIDFGEHKNTLLGDIRSQDDDGNPVDRYRSDLIFKNPDGTPKTTSTARLYNLNKETLPPKFSAFASRYQEDSAFTDTPAPRNDESPSLKVKPSSPAKQSSLRTVIASEIDKVRRIGADGILEGRGSVRANKLADAFTDFYEKYTTYRGKLNNTFADSVKDLVKVNSSVKGYLKQDNELAQTSLKKMYDNADGAKVTFTPEETKIRAEVQKMMKHVRELHRAKPHLRQPGEDNPNYVPHITKLSVINERAKNPESDASKQLDKEFIDYQVKKMVAKGADKDKAFKKAQENLAALVDGYHKKKLNIAENYGPIDKAEGFGLPESWRETKLLNMMDRYLDRVSRRFAYADTLETPEMKDALKALGSNKHVETVFDNISGIQGPDDRMLNSMMGVVSSANMGPLTGARDFTANLTLGWQHHANPVQAIKSGIHALAHLKENIADAYKMGRIRTHMSDLEWGETVGVLRRFKDVLTDAQGRNFLEKITRGTAMGQGKFTTLDFLEDYRKGQLSTMGKKWFEDFGKDVDWKKKSLTKEELNTIAARYVDSVQGTYDYRGLPRYANEGMISPLLKLARWNIEKANNYQKHVVNPLLDGNIVPLLNSTIGMLVGGTAVNMLTEQLSGRKDKLPEWKEIQASKEDGNDIKMAVLYKSIGLASAAGWAGIVGDVGKNIMDRMYGKVKPRWYSNMLLEFGNSTSATIFNTVEALQEEGPSLGLVTSAVSDVIENNLQMYRLLLARVSEDTISTGNEEQVEQSNKMRDLRTFKTLNDDNDSSYLASDYKEDYSQKDLKKFKNSEDPAEIAELLPDLIDKALKKANGNQEVLKKELSKIKRNSYQTMPNPDTMPSSFIKYLNHLKKTQGKEEANKRLLDYLKRNEINSTKSSLVPSL